MKLITFITKNQDSIVESWVKFASSMQPWAKDLSSKELEDHAREILHALVKDMASFQSKDEQAEKAKGSGFYGTLAKIGQKHASGRVKTGISVVQLASEFRALRASILSKWEESEGFELGEVTRFNEGIDESLAHSIMEYAETIDSTRDHFLAILSHDLRNPLNAITMAATVLKNPQPTKMDIPELILNSSQKMTRMINDLLDLARTRLGEGIPVSPKPMDMEALCQETMLEIKAAWPKQRLEFKAVGNLKGEWDSDRMAQVITNLVTNALYYGASEKPVSVVARDDGEDIALEVHNEGTPIPESVQKTIFAPMTRHTSEGKDEDKNVRGLGLGLYIASEIVKAHSGVIRVTSTAGEGTTFTVLVPRRPVAIKE